jgi:hypothetical protein
MVGTNIQGQTIGFNFCKKRWSGDLWRRRQQCDWLYVSFGKTVSCHTWVAAGRGCGGGWGGSGVTRVSAGSWQLVCPLPWSSFSPSKTWKTTHAYSDDGVFSIINKKNNNNIFSVQLHWTCRNTVSRKCIGGGV